MKVCGQTKCWTQNLLLASQVPYRLRYRPAILLCWNNWNARPVDKWTDWWIDDKTKAICPLTILGYKTKKNLFKFQTSIRPFNWPIINYWPLDSSYWVQMLFTSKFDLAVDECQHYTALSSKWLCNIMLPGLWNRQNNRQFIDWQIVIS